MKPGDRVTIVTPDNPRLHGAAGLVVALEDWGAHVLTRAAATGRLRAAWCEMVTEAVTAAAAVAETTAAVAVAQGYTGDVCDRCFGVRLRRAGSCLTCDDCGATTGC